MHVRAAGRIGLALLLLLLTVSPLFAAGEAHKGPSEVIFVAQLLALMIAGRLLGEAMLRIGQPAVMGQLIAGLLLGPSLFGLLLPDVQHALFPGAPEQKAMIDAVSQFGILLLLLLTGMETDLKLVRQSGRASLFASLAGICVPFACGVALGETLPDSLLPDPGKRFITSLFLGLALSIASVKIVAMVVREMNFMRRMVGQVILASAIIDDSVGWIIVSIIFSLAAHGTVDAMALAQSVIGAFAFLAISLTIGRRAVFFIIRWVNDTFVSEFAVITAILVLMCAMSLITSYIGVHSVLGAFVAGVLVGESPILTKHIDDQLRGIITAFFAPVFFGMAGLSADLTILKDPMIVALTAGLIVIASIGKFGGAFVGGHLGGLRWKESFALACGMNARGSTEVIVATIGLSMGALSQNLFTMIVAMAVLTTLAMPPTLRWALSRLPLRKEEKQRLEREEMEEKGFVPNLERLLIAVDDSPNGQFTARVAGLIAGTHGMPTTVLHIKHGKIEDDGAKERKEAKEKKAEESKSKVKTRAEEKLPDKEGEGKKPSEVDDKTRADAEHAGETVRESAEEIKRKQPEEEKSEAEVDVTTIVHDKAKPEAVAAEAKKGYDLLFIGMQKTAGRGHEFHAEVSELASPFEGPLVVSATRNGLEQNPKEEKLNILVPVNGTEPSRRAAEVAITIARATKSPLTALYVSARGGSGKRQRRNRRNEEAILKDIVAIGEGYDMSIRTSVAAGKAPDAAILKEAGKRKSNLIVMGSARRPGEKLNFGDTAAALLENAKTSVLFVAS